jgi:hypothetical protein
MGKITLFFKISAASNALASKFKDISKEYTDTPKYAMWVKPERKKI